MDLFVFIFYKPCFTLCAFSMRFIHYFFLELGSLPVYRSVLVVEYWTIRIWDKGFETSPSGPRTSERTIQRMAFKIDIC